MPPSPRAMLVLALLAALSAQSLPLAAEASAGGGGAFPEGCFRPLGPGLRVYEDPAGVATPAEVLRMYGAGALPSLGRASLSAGYTTSTFWLVEPLPPGAEGERLYLFTTDTGLYRLRLFVPGADGSLEAYEGSYAQPYSRRAVPIANPALAFSIPEEMPPEDRAIVFSVRSDSSIHTSFVLADAIGLYKFKLERTVVLTSVFVVLIGLFLYNAFVLLFAKDRRYLSYILYLGAYILYLADLHCLDFELLFPGLPGSWTKTVSPLLGSASLVLSALFAKSFLGIGRESKVLRPCMLALAGLGGSLAAVSVSGLRYGLVSEYGNDLASAFVVVVTVVAIARILQGYKPAAFFLLANLGLVAGVLAYGLWENGYLPNTVLASSATLLGQTLQLVLFSASLAYRLGLERRERVSAQEALLRQEESFRRFVPLEFIEFLGKRDIGEIRLGQHVEKEMCVMFADIRSFTSLSEAMTPRETFDFINDYLRRIVPTIKDYGGFIDKFMGDSIMALFPNSADDALRAAIEMQGAIASLNEERAERGAIPIRAGIGLHTGSLMLGIIGDAERLESTVLSDSVNLASRVEKLNRFFGSSILITSASFKDLQDPLEYRYRFLGRVKVKGKTEAAPIFEVFDGEPEARRRLKLETQRPFEQGLVAYLLRDFPRARSFFSGILRKDGDDRAAAYYYLHSKRAMEAEPGPGWDGTIEPA